jgi:beta-lactamase class D
MTKRTSCFLAALLSVVACHPQRSNMPVPGGAAQLQVVAHAGLSKLLEDEHLRGTVAVLRDDERVVHCADVALCSQRVVPASTFKIANSMIGLETGVIADADFVIPWDGVTRELADWNRDHTLRSAIKASAVPYYQELARRVGQQGMAEWTARLDYGNTQTGDASQVDSFWLHGPLAISPVEQLVFLRRFAREELPISPRTRDIVRDIMVLADGDGPVLRGKTGWGHPHEPNELGWFVGYVERRAEARAQGGASSLARPRSSSNSDTPRKLQRTYVAVLLQREPAIDQATFLSARRRIAEKALSDLGAW